MWLDYKICMGGVNNMKVLIPTSGLGSRLGDLTRYTNKALVKIGDKPVISHIIDMYPTADFVVTLGYLGDYVKQFLTLCYPDKNFEFIQVDPYEGPGSSLLKSISFAKDVLQCPFIFHVCDTVVEKLDLKLDCNWMACGISDKSDIFRTVVVKGSYGSNINKIASINEKGELNYDYVYLGVAGIVDYETFWSNLLNIISNNISTDLSDCHVFKNMLSECDINVNFIDDWHDTGSITNLNCTRSFYKQSYDVLDKYEEAIYFVGDVVIKFFVDEFVCKNRVRRAALLNGLIPELMGSTKNFYKYKLADGELLSHSVSEHKVCALIEWAEKNLWIPVDTDRTLFYERCRDFYITKTRLRIQKFLSMNNISDDTVNINDMTVPPCDQIMNAIDWDMICKTDPVRFHGDFILDNILYKDGSFILLDWRQDFAGDVDVGDIYYDIAKLNHNLIFNHAIISNNGYQIYISDDGITCDLFRSHNMMLYQQALMDWLESKGYNSNKIRLLTYLIWINMSPLHTYPLNKFLFYFGKYNLWRELCQNYT